MYLQYSFQVWLNFRRKSTEGCSAYSPILAVLGGVFSVLQMFLLSYNYGTNDYHYYKSTLSCGAKFNAVVE